MSATYEVSKEQVEAAIQKSYEDGMRDTFRLIDDGLLIAAEHGRFGYNVAPETVIRIRDFVRKLGEA